MRVMIFTPTWRTREGLAMLPECREAIEGQQIDGSTRWVVGVENPWPIPDGRNVFHQYVMGREMFLAGDHEGNHEGLPYDALLFVEHDNVLPDPSALQRMIETAADVVYAPYMLRHNSNVLSLWQHIGSKNIGESLSLHRDELIKARQAVTWRVSGVGFGCTLIRRHVLEAIEFRKSEQAPDIPFAEDCLRAGYVAMARMDVPVLHWQSGRWLHPWQKRGEMSTYLANATMNALAAGRFVRLIEGETIELSEEEAKDLIRAGFISGPVPESPPGVAPAGVQRAVNEASEQATAPAQRRRKSKE